MNSCIYEGQVRHARYQPVVHSFSYRLFLMYLDLDELPSLFEGRWFWSTRRAAIARFRREHHLGDPTRRLADCVRDLVERNTGRRPEGPVRLLTNLSYFGYCFNPVSFYYCYGEDGQTLDAIVAEVNNTPWGEQDTYVMAVAPGDASRTLRFSPKKKMHVSPFMPMDIEYEWRLSRPGARLGVNMSNFRDGERIFDAGMSLARTPMTSTSMARVLVAYPFMTMKVIAAIYWQALRLWMKRVPFQVHPEKNEIMVTR